MAVASLPVGLAAYLTIGFALYCGGTGISGPRGPEIIFMAGMLLSLLAVLFGAVGMKRNKGFGIAGVVIGAVCAVFCTVLCVMGFIVPDMVRAWFFLDFGMMRNPPPLPR